MGTTLCKFGCHSLKCNRHDLDYYNKFILLTNLKFNSAYEYLLIEYNLKYIIKRSFIIKNIKKELKFLNIPIVLLNIIYTYIDSYNIYISNNKYYIDNPFFDINYQINSTLYKQLNIKS